MQLVQFVAICSIFALQKNVIYDLRDRKQASGDLPSTCNFLALSVSFFSDLTIAHKI